MSVIYSGKEYKVQDSIFNRSVLDLSGQGIKSINEIKGLETLTDLLWLELKLNHNKISEIEGLESLTNLVKLDLSENPIQTLKGLDTLVHLRELNLCKCNIYQIQGLKSLTNLVILDLSYNPIATLKGLDNLSQLQSLNLFKCNISQIENLNNKDRLKYLILGNNPIYKIFHRAELNRKKLSSLTEEERFLKGISPRLWEIASNFQGKLLSNPKIPEIKSKPQRMSGDSGINQTAEFATGTGQICCECFSVVLVLVCFVPFLKLLF